MATKGKRRASGVSRQGMFPESTVRSRLVGEEAMMMMMIRRRRRRRRRRESWRVCVHLQHREVQSLAFVSAKKQIAVRDVLEKQLLCVLWEEGGVRSVYRHISLIAIGSSSNNGERVGRGLAR